MEVLIKPRPAPRYYSTLHTAATSATSATSATTATTVTATATATGTGATTHYHTTTLSPLIMYIAARLARTNHRVPLRSFSVAEPARKEGDTGSPKPRGFLAEYVHSDFQTLMIHG